MLYDPVRDGPGTQVPGLQERDEQQLQNAKQHHSGSLRAAYPRTRANRCKNLSPSLVDLRKQARDSSADEEVLPGIHPEGNKRSEAKLRPLAQQRAEGDQWILVPCKADPACRLAAGRPLPAVRKHLRQEPRGACVRNVPALQAGPGRHRPHQCRLLICYFQKRCLYLIDFI